MNWQDERWVKLYTRDSGDWLFLSFDAQALFLLLLRKVNQEGSISLGRNGVKAIPVLLGHAEAAIRISEALEALLAVGCVRLCGEELVIPNFSEAQEAVTSPAERRRRFKEKHGVWNASERNGTQVNGSELVEEKRREEKKELVARERAPGSPFQAFLLEEWGDIKNPAEYERRAKDAHPRLDLLAEAKKAKGYEVANPRKAKSNHGNYFWRWLSRAEKFLEQNAPPDAQEKRKSDERAVREIAESKRRGAELEALPRSLMPEALKAQIAKIGGGKF